MPNAVTRASKPSPRPARPDADSPPATEFATPLIRLSAEPIRVEEALRAVASPRCGGTALFIGTVRNDADAARDRGLCYEAYASMALRELKRLADDLEGRYPGMRFAAVHRIGFVPLGEASVAIAVAAPHRREAFAACREAVEILKRDVPLWKI